MSDRPFTVADLADRWACSRRHIYNLIERGELKVFHAGGTLRRISKMSGVRSPHLPP
ncbi:MAG: DNA-binding protein [Hyphomicrobiaceae bacterium]|nr:MAG: DNA-binding protein [Hyphomicrobiaceae bacterium]